MVEPNVRQLAQLLHTVLNARRYTHRSDLVEDFKAKCAKLRMVYDSASIEAAINMVEGAGRRRDIPRVDPEHQLPRVGQPTELASGGPTLSRHDAASILATIRKRLNVPELKPKVMPAAPPEDPRVIFERDRARAAMALVNAIVESAATCDALESTITAGPGDEEPARVAPSGLLQVKTSTCATCPDCKQSKPTSELRSGPFITTSCRTCGHVYAVRDAEPARTWTRRRHRTWTKAL
jgi:hypothetical protein